MAESEADEIYRVNKLLAIEDMDWSHQLSQAVSIFRKSMVFKEISSLAIFFVPRVSKIHLLVSGMPAVS